MNLFEDFKKLSNIFLKKFLKFLIKFPYRLLCVTTCLSITMVIYTIVVNYVEIYLGRLSTTNTLQN
jgi:hypothetical protein